MVYLRRVVLVCSIDGACQETYSIYRQGGNFKRVIENIKKINQYKALYRSNFPVLTWQFVIFGHNEHEIETMRQMAKSLNMNVRLKLSWNEQFSPVKNIVKHGETGFLVPPGNVDALALALLHLLQNCELAEQMGKAGREVAIAQFSEATYVDRFVHLYQTLLEKVEFSKDERGICHEAN